MFSHDKNLGLLSHVKGYKKRPFLFVADHVKRRLSEWMSKLMSRADREVMIQAVAQVIPTNAVNVFRFSRELSYSNQASINQFWWGCQ